MSKHSRNMMWSLAWIWLACVFCNVAQAVAPDWQVVNYPNYTGVLARVKLDGVPIHSEGSLLAAFHGEELRGVAEILGANPDDDIDGEYYFSLLFGSSQSGETGFTFKLWNSVDDTIYDLDKTLDFDTNYPQKPEIYGGFTAAGFAPCIMNVVPPAPTTYAITIVNGTASKAEAAAGEEITITSNNPDAGMVFDKWMSDDVTIANATATTTTFEMPEKAVTVTATFVVKNPTVTYTLSPAEAVTAGAQWKIDDGAWNDSGATVTTTVGAHTISFKEVAGFATPENQTITLAAGDLNTGTVTYVEAVPSEYTLTVVKGTINGTTATTGKFAPGEIVTIAATLPSNQGLKIWTPDTDMEFIGSVLGATTTIKMPSHDVTVTASFVTKSSMPAVSVRSTTNEGDDSAQEPTSATAAADKGRFTFTRTSSSGSLTVYFDIRGTAANGVDYKTIPSSITFASGKTSVECEIEPLFDELIEGDETVEVVLIPATPTQTYRGGTYTNAALTIKDPEFATVQYTLSPDEAVTAGAQWKIDDGGWNNSGATVTTTIGSHVISFKDVAGYARPASQTITLAANEAKIGSAAYVIGTSKYTLTVSGGTINGTSSSTGQFMAGEEITIAATLPSGQGLKIWTPSKDVEFTGSVLGATTTIVMPAYDVTVTASFVAKSSMQAVAVRSTTNEGDDTAKEPSSATAAATNKGKFTFTRTSSSGSLTVYFDIRGTATNGTDYKTIPSSVTFASGKTSVELDIEPLYDSLNEGDETVQVVLIPATPTQTYRGGAATDATVTIQDIPVVVDDPTVKYTLSPAAAVAAGAQWRIDDGDWNDSGATVTTTAGGHTISFKSVEGYTAPDSQNVTLAAGETKTGTAAYAPVGGDAPYHPADCKTQDYFISGLEFLEYAGPVKAAALGNYEYTWDGSDVLSFARKATRGLASPQTRGGGFAVTREVSSPMFMAGSTVEVTLAFSGTDTMTSLFIGERIPEGWTVAGDAAGSVVNGVLRVMWDSPDIPSSFTYVIQAPAENLAASYVISSNSEDTACFADYESHLLHVEDTVLTNNYHPADSVTKDGKISGLEYLIYAGPVKALALANDEYTWDGDDVLSIRKKNATRGGAADADAAIARSVDTAIYEADVQVTVTLSISGVESMVSLFVGERIPEGWSVVGNYADNVRNGVLRMAWDAPNIPETITYTLQAPAENLPLVDKIASSSADTGCFTNRVLFLDAGETILANGAVAKPAEWPEDMALYAPADGRNFRENDNLAVTFGWPAIRNAENYRLVVAAYDGTVVFDGMVEETAVTIRGLECGSYIWNITAIGDDCIAGTSEDFRFAVVPAVSVPIITGAFADGTTVKLVFDTAEAGYTDGVFTYQAVFYSLETQTMTNVEQTVAVANGKAVIALGVAASNGYLYIRPVTTPESYFTELYVK